MVRRFLGATGLTSVLLLSACSTGSATRPSHTSLSAPSTTSSVESTTTPSSSPVVSEASPPDLGSSGFSGTSGGSPTTTVTPSGTTTPVTILPAGVYTDGSPSVPHYIVTLSSSEAGEVSGALAIAYQDGRHSTLFTFNAHPTVKVFALNASSAAYHPEAVIQGGELILPGCSQYLQYAVTAAQCRFAPSG
jgi:hypothetical protein